MPPRKYRSKRRPRRARRARRGGLRAPRSQLKHYNYTFKLSPQLVRSDAAAIGSATLVGTSAMVPITSVASFSGTMNAVGYADLGLACSHKLSDIQNYASFAGLYDAYKINSVSVNVEYLNNVALQSACVNPTVWMYWDQDDATIPGNVAAILGKTGAKRWNVNDKMKASRSFRYIPLTRNNASSTDVIVPNRSQWINCTAPNVPHYAFKMFVQDFNAPGAEDILNCFRFNWTYNVSFRSPLVAT